MLKGSSKTLPLSMLRRHSVRQKQRSREQLLALAENYRDNPIHPIVVGPPSGEPPLYNVADGNSRLDGLELLGETETEVFVSDEPLCESDLNTIAFVTAFHREGLTCFEQALIVCGMKRDGMTGVAIGKLLGVNEGWVSKLGRLDDCCEAVRDAAQEGKIGPNEWAKIAGADDQLHALAAALKGREALDHATKPRKPGGTPGGKTARVSIPLAVASDDYDARGTVTIASLPGQEIDYEEVQNLLKEALKAVKKAIGERVSLKAFQVAMKSVATAAKATA